MSLLSPPLHAFAAIVQAGTVHGAAEMLHLTQTAVTQRLKSLEQALKATLFVRTRRGMVLTTEGEALWRFYKASRELEAETVGMVQGVGRVASAKLTMTGPTSLIHSRVIPACIPVIKKHTLLQLQFMIDDKEERHLALKEGKCDFAIVEPIHVSREMAWKELNPEQYVLVASPLWKKRKLTEIIHEERIVDFDESDDMSVRYLQHFNLAQKVRTDRHFVNRPESMVTLIASGCGYGVLTKEFAKPYLDAHELIALNRGQIYQHQMRLVWYERKAAPDYFSAILRAIT